MQITIYLDIIFVINFIADLSILLMTGMILKQKIVLWRMVIGAAFGSGMFLPFMFLPPMLINKSGIVIYIGISFGAVFITFGKKNGGVIKKWFLTTTLMILLGGMMNLLRNTMGITSVRFLLWMGIFLGGSTLSLFMIFGLKKILYKEKYIYLIRIQNKGKIAIDYTYLDTGNMLWDPLFNKPVILLSEEFAKACMTEDEKKIFEKYKMDGRVDYDILINNSLEIKNYFHEIAYRSLGNPSGKLLCFLVEEVFITEIKKELKKQPVAIAPSDLFKGKEYKGLLHQECI